MSNVALILGGYINGYSIIRELSSCDVDNIWLFDYGDSLARKSNLILGSTEIEKNTESLLSELYKLNKKFERIVIYPTDDVQLELLAKIYDKISPFCYVPLNPKNLSESLDKNYQYEVCSKLDIPFPKTLSIISNNDLKNTYNFYNNMFSIPSHVWMTDKDFNYLISSCIKELKKIKYLEK